MTLKNMASESGGLLSKRKDTCLQFDHKPQAVVYLPSLSCLIGTLSYGTVQVLDIHSGCTLRNINFSQEEPNGTKIDSLLCGVIEDSEKLLICRGNVIGCRGILGEKVLLDSILQYDCKDKSTWKIELDLVQAGILLNGLQSCQRLSSSPQFGAPAKSEEDVKVVSDELQKQYEKVLAGVKDFGNKSVKWMTVCLEMEKQLLTDAFVWVYTVMSRQMQDPSLPIIGDVVRRISLCNPPKKKNDFGRIERILMLGEVERLETFQTWPHKDYEYALPGSMAEAGFYHPAYSTASEDRAICFKCDICLVYWEPSDQPWSEHERHSSSCPFVKGEYTGNVPLSVCAAVGQAESLKHQEEKIVCIGKQSCDGLAVVGTSRGTVYLLETFPVLKIKSKLKKFSNRRLLELGLSSQLSKIKNADLKSYSSSSSMNIEGDDLEENSSKAELFEDIQQVEAEVVAESSEADIQILESNEANESSTVDINVKDQPEDDIAKKDPNKDLKVDSFNVEIQALTICKHHVFGDGGIKSVVNSIIIGRKCSVVVKEGGEDVRRQTLSIAVVDKNSLKKVDTERNAEKSKGVATPVVHPYPGLVEDPMFYNDFGSYVGGDTGELSVINEYLRANAQKEKDKKARNSKKKDSLRRTMRCQEFRLPSSVDPKHHTVSHLFATKASLFVVVKCNEATNRDTVHLEEQDEYSSVDSDTEVIEMPNGDSSQCRPVRRYDESFIFEYRWLLRGDTIFLHEPHISSRSFSCREYLHDVIMTSNKNLGFKEQLCGVVGEKVCIDSSGIDVLLAATGIESKQICIISTVDLQTLSVIPIDNIEPCSTIEHIVYCKGISVVACCCNDGKVALCHLDDQPMELQERPSGELIPQAGQSSLEGPITEEKLSQLVNLTKFEAISSGVHVLLPMDWVVGTASLSANAPLQSKRRLHPHVRDIYPITSPSLPKSKTGLPDSKLKERRLRSKDQSVSFKVFVSSETAVGYIDLSVQCCQPITEDSNVIVSLYLIKSNHFLEDSEDSRQRELISGPILLSEHCSSSSCKVSIMLTSSKLTMVKSSYLALDLEYQAKASSISDTKQNEATAEQSNNDMAIADFVTNVQIIVYQYSPVPSDSLIPASCRMYLIEDLEIKRRLLKQFLDASWNRTCLGEDSEARRCLEVIVWIWNMLTYSNESIRDEFVALVVDDLPDLVEVSFSKGDRTLAHRFYQLVTSIYSYSKKESDNNFQRLLISALMKLMQSVQCFFSVGALRWFFRLCNVAVSDCSIPDAEHLLSAMLVPLADVVRMHRDSITDEQLLLQTRFDLSGSALEPVVAEPVSIELITGDSLKQKAEVIDHHASSSTQKAKNSVSIPASDIPGILEVDQLGFTCLMSSEGSKCEKSAMSYDFQTNSMKVGLKPESSCSIVDDNKNLYQSMSLTSLDYDEDLPDLGPQSLYEDLDNLESVSLDFDGLDYNVYEVLEAENFDLWTTPSVSHGGGMDRRAKVVKRKGRFTKQTKTHDIDNEFITPETMLLVVDRMHAAAQHFAVIDFQRPVNLTDVLIPPCESLSSISLYAWKEHQTEKEAVHVVTYSEIAEKVLVLTDIIPSIKCRYLKIIANGCHKLRSTKVSIALGNFYGRPVDGTYKLSLLKSRLQQQYDRAYCRYALACDRLINHLEDAMKYCSESDEAESDETHDRLISSYKDCAKAQLSLNHVYRSLKFYESQSNPTKDILPKGERAPLSLDFMRVLTECLIDTLLLTLRSYTECKDTLGPFEMQDINLNLDRCLELFQNFCFLGSAKIRQRGSMLLQCICETQPWWKEFIVSLLKYCFEDKASHGMPKDRLFALFVKMLKTAGDLNAMLLSLIEMLQGVLSPLFDRRSGNAQLDFEMLDWLLLVLNEVFQNSDQGDWLFLTPWSAIAREANSLETRSQEKIRRYIQKQHKALANLHKNFQVLATTAKKKYSNMVVKVPEGSSSSKELKDLLLLRRHPLFNKRKRDNSVKAPWGLLEEEQSNFEKSRTGRIDKKHILPSVRALLKLMLVSRSEDDFERLVLACKVATQILDVSSTPVYLAEIAHLDDLVNLLQLPLYRDCAHALWINHAVLCFIRQTLHKGNSTQSSSDIVGIPEERNTESPVNLETKAESSPPYGSSGDSSETLSGQEGEAVEEKLTDIASSIATNLMKAIKETVGDKKDATKEAGTRTGLQSGRGEQMQSVSHLVDGFDRNFQVESNDKFYFSCNLISEIMAKGLWRDKIQVEEQCGENTFDQQGCAEDQDLVCSAFAELAKVSNNMDVVVNQWLAVSSIPKDFTSQPQLRLPIDVAHSLMISHELISVNRYNTFLYESAMKSFINRELRSVEVEPFLVLQSSLELQSDQSGRASSSLLLLKAFGECFYDNTEPSKATENATETASGANQPDSNCKLFIKNLVLEVLRNGRCGDVSCQDVLVIANKMHIFEILEEDEVEVTFEILKVLASSFCSFVKESREMLALSFTETNMSRKRMYIVDSGRSWQVGKLCTEESESHLHNYVLLLNKLVCSLFTNSVSGSMLLEMLYNRESNVIENLLEILFIAGDPPIQPNLKHDFPTLLMPQRQLAVKEAEFHPDIECTYDIVLKLASNVIDRHRILQSILSYLVSTRKQSFLISKAMARLLKSLLQSKADVELFIERGGLLMICDRICRNAESLRWSSGKMAGLSISRALFSQEELQESKVKTLTDIDGSELKNFAPCGRILSPPNRPPADILLQQQLTHRRPRFAAWSYHFNDNTQEWLELTIELPFAILLKQVAIYQHQSFLGNCPAEINIEVKGCGEVFIPHSPNLLASGLNVVDIYLARGLPAKAVRINMKRPLGSDVIKMNNIALFGKAALSPTEKQLVSEFDSRYYWIDLLNHLEKDADAIEKLDKLNGNSQSLITALMVFANLSSSGRVNNSEILFGLMVKIFKRNVDDWIRILTTSILPNYGKGNSAFKHPAVRTDIGRFLMLAVMQSLDSESKSKCLLILLRWSIRAVQSGLSEDAREFHHHPTYYFDCIADIVNDLSGTETVDLSVVRDLAEVLSSQIMKIGLKDHERNSCSRLLASLVVFDSKWLEALVDKGLRLVEKSELLGVADEERVLLNVLSSLGQNESIVKSLIESNLPSKICSHIGRILTVLSSGTSDNLYNSLSSLYILLRYIHVALAFCDFKEWFGSSENLALLQALLEFLSTAYHDKCLVTKQHNNRDLVLGLIHKLQHITIKMIKRMTSFNHQNQVLFVDIIRRLLSKDTKPEISLFNNSFLKRLVLQLILEEETVVVEFQRGNGKMNVGESGVLDHSSLDLKNVTRKRLKLSDRLSSIFPDKKNVQSSSSEKPKQSLSAGESHYANPYEEPLEDVDWNDNPNMSVILASAQFASAKRQAKSEAASNDKNASACVSYGIEYYHNSVSKDSLPYELTIGQILYILESNGHPCSDGLLTLHVHIKEMTEETPNSLKQLSMLQSDTYPTLLHVFAADGGIQLLAKHSRISLSGQFGQTISTSIGFLMRFVSLPGFSDMFLKENQQAEHLLRLMLGEEESSSGGLIAASSLARDLPLLPFLALQDLFKKAPLQSEYGQSLRKEAFDKDIVKLLLSHLGSLCSQDTSKKDPTRKTKKAEKTDMRPSYWARGTGFGTGSTASTWDVEKVMQEKKKEDEQVICLLEVLSSYMDPLDSTKLSPSGDGQSSLPDGMITCLEESPLRTVLANYLRNDSVLDMARHIPLFNALMQILRALSSNSSLIPLLLPMGMTTNSSATLAGQAGSIDHLLSRLKECADTYINRLKATKKKKSRELRKGTQASRPIRQDPDQSDQVEDGSPELASEALTLLIENIQETSQIVQRQIKSYEQRIKEERDHNKELHLNDNGNGDNERSVEETYMAEMKNYQFGTFEFVSEEGDDGKVEFLVPFYFAEKLRTAVATGDFSYSSRARRLAQEIASLSTSLPLSFSSSVFLRCDENRLDLMKVLITGPEDTPYANGCFEFDVYFPRDYPNSPMMVNLQTNGQHSVRFNPNLYNDGKVCLSILNTWHGRPEEKWNPQTSNLLQVLVSIQSLILVPEPYFNEPGYERSRGTPIGQQNSMDYSANIKQATIKWAMLEQLRNPAPCFKQIIRRHFYLKKAAIIKQCEQWITQVKDHSSKKKSVAVHYEAMKRHFATLKVELDKLTKEQLTSDSPSPHLPQPPPYSNPDSFDPEKENVVYL